MQNLFQWEKEWPVKPGFYWFYGQIDKSFNFNDLILVEVVKNSRSDSMTYMATHTFLYPESAGKCVWAEATLPEVSPDLLK